mgnify:CR=1 FL=1
MARMIICDICEATYAESYEEQHKVEINGKILKVFIDLDLNNSEAGFGRIDACKNCRQQALHKVLEQ